VPGELQRLIREQRHYLEQELSTSMAPIARRCACLWQEADELDAMLSRAINEIAGCHLIYAFDAHALKVSSNIARNDEQPAERGASLAGRPFLSHITPSRKLVLSDIYVSRVTGHSCVTAIHTVLDTVGRRLGYLAADFSLKELPLPGLRTGEQTDWRQIRGDPSIRSMLFQQTRSESAMDRHIDDAHNIINELMCDRGVFHAELHYGSSRATLWLSDDPCRYRIHVLHEIIDPSVCLLFKRNNYPEQASLPAPRVSEVLRRFRDLRLADNTIYLRAASLNLVNNLVSLTFSCDGTHYMPSQDFLARPDSFWFGQEQAAFASP
jgi:hypothetical protein